MLQLLASWWPPSLATSTFALAAVTFVLVVVTALLAWFGSRDIAAQERPVLLVDERQIKFQRENAGTREERILLKCYVENAGRGPALNIQAKVRIDITKAFRPKDLPVTDEPPQQSLSTNESSRSFEWRFLPPGPPVPPDWRIDLRYFDLSGRRFRTWADFTVGADYGVSPGVNQRVYRVPGHRDPAA